MLLLMRCNHCPLIMESSRLSSTTGKTRFITTGKTSAKDGRSLSCGVYSLLHRSMIPIPTMCLGQGRKLTDSTQEGCRGEKTTCSHLKSLDRLDAILAKQRPFWRLSLREKKRRGMSWTLRLAFRESNSKTGMKQSSWKTLKTMKMSFWKKGRNTM